MQPTHRTASTAVAPSIAGTLRRTALYLTRNGWIQDTTYAKPALSQAAHVFPAADLLGALTVTITGRTILPAEVGTEAGTDAATEFASAVTYLAGWLCLTDDVETTNDPYRALWHWNDAPWQDLVHVVDGLLRAAADIDGLTYNAAAFLVVHTNTDSIGGFSALDTRAGVR